MIFKKETKRHSYVKDVLIRGLFLFLALTVGLIVIANMKADDSIIQFVFNLNRVIIAIIAICLVVMFLQPADKEGQHKIMNK